MPDSPNLPAKPPPLDRAAIERVLARASELQASSANTDQSGLLTEAELLEIGKEAGVRYVDSLRDDGARKAHPPWSLRLKASSRLMRPTIVAPQTRARRRRDGCQLPIR